MADVNSPLLQLLQRNAEIFAGKRVLFVGAIYDPALLQLTKSSARAQVLCDSFACAKQMAAMLGQTLQPKLTATATLKHISVTFAPRQLFTPEPCDILCLLLDKTKAVNQALLHELSPYVAPSGMILAAGANDAGGKSADTYLKPHGRCGKLDTARKCTLWQLLPDADKPFAAPPTALTLKPEEKMALLTALNSHDFSKVALSLADKPRLELEDAQLLQDCQVFSPGRIDDGTLLLLDALAEAPTMEQAPALDLCCGCGIVGLQLHYQGFAVSACDNSAAALFVTILNYATAHILEPLEQERILPSDMLTDLPADMRYALIAVNPPFHQGVKTDNSLSRNLLNAAPERLLPEGSLVIVGNTFLQYDKALRCHFALVKDLRRTTRFAVQRAAQPRL